MSMPAKSVHILYNDPPRAGKRSHQFQFSCTVCFRLGRTDRQDPYWSRLDRSHNKVQNEMIMRNSNWQKYTLIKSPSDR